VSHHIIHVNHASRYEVEQYGILYRARCVHRIRGAKHNPRSQFSIKIWTNTVRPNPHPGEVRYTEFGARGGDGQYLDPNGKGTDDVFSVTTSAEATVISRTPLPRTPEGETLEIGDTVTFSLPSGLESGPWLIAQRALHDPHMEPVK